MISLLNAASKYATGLIFERLAGKHGIRVFKNQKTELERQNYQTHINYTWIPL